MAEREAWRLAMEREDELEVTLGIFATAEEARAFGDRVIKSHGYPLSGWSIDGWSDQVPNHHGQFFFRELGHLPDEPPYDSIFVEKVKVFF